RLLLDRLSATLCMRMYLPKLNKLADLFAVEVNKQIDLREQSEQQIAFYVFQLAQRLNWTPSVLHAWTASEWQTVVEEIGLFDDLERRRVLHLAYEHRYRTQILDAVSEHSKLPLKIPEKVSFQVITCIDDREESFRRHLEELDPNVETFGATGFFSVPMY
ncbi:MAG: putative inorganic carbon transporter subunit DabA, partial [Pirellula sp.]